MEDAVGTWRGDKFRNVVLTVVCTELHHMSVCHAVQVFPQTERCQDISDQHDRPRCIMFKFRSVTSQRLLESYTILVSSKHGDALAMSCVRFDRFGYFCLALSRMQQ